MDELQEQVIAQVQAAGGELSYRALYDATDPVSRRMLPNVLQRLDAARTHHQIVIAVPGGRPNHVIRTGAHPRYSGGA